MVLCLLAIGVGSCSSGDPDPNGNTNGAVVPAPPPSPPVLEPEGVTLALNHPSALLSPQVLYSGWKVDGIKDDGTEDVTCHHFSEHVSGQFHDLLTSIRAGPPNCPVELVVFARGFAPAVVTDIPWSQLSQDIDLVVDLPPQRTIPVSVWLVQLPPASPEYYSAYIDLPKTNDVLKGWRLGVDLDFGHTPFPEVSADSPEAEKIGNGCAQLEEVRSPGSGVYTLGALNIYYVAELVGAKRADPFVPPLDPPVSLSLIAQNCGAFGAPEVIYIKNDAPHFGHVLHEIGHALGSWEPGKGHVAVENNFMQSGTVSTTIFEGVMSSGSASLAQLYRMNFDTRSWINAGMDFTPPRKSCQVAEHGDWMPCP